ncbi:variant surface glycoprotein (VSG, atypical), putative [Trypanosoma brucei brucei TREU927]|uniref:Variant surface glycoprotein (VSG, atypical), putative n=1 Tax=Trypanosoma brucei brucei (strain 927/4 GUTat10.1) TaxID=185431 RepID=Q580N9_TRYB2|nr:variant surface glycoprotein (VSG, atypical), putative [Trypanosoma brucei brucei TREU927]AAX79145.1 variant surface glycoprotein (VSG, atypical), putative [Trypanosoma brucei]AAZ11135.1 variant surface glycoprotein (VSG, atypical), putative [Trypanosoma brucei brucei TREU927]
MPPKLGLALPLLIASVTSPRPGEATAGNVIKKANWQAICKVTADAGNLAGLALTNIRAPGLQVAADIKALLRTLIYIEGNSTSAATKVQGKAAAFLAGQTAENLEYYSSTSVATDVTTARDAGRLHGATHEFMSVQADGSTSANGCIGDNESGSNALAGFSAVVEANPNCQLSWETVTTYDGTVTAITKTGLGGKFANAIAHNKFTSGDRKCNINSAASGFKLNNDGTSVDTSGNKPKMAAGIISLDAANGIRTIALANVMGDDEHPYLKAAATAAKRSKQTPKAADLTTADTALASTDFKKAARRHILGKKETADDSDTTLAAKVKKAFGSDESINKLISTNVNNMPIAGILTDNTDAKSLGQITDISELVRLYFYYSDLNKQKLADTAKKPREAEAKTATKSAEEKEKECNTKGKDKQDGCEKLKDQGCVFNKDGDRDKKCTLSKEGKKEAVKAAESKETNKDGKTNTTGRNSFVIKDSPLWLAFLLFN